MGSHWDFSFWTMISSFGMIGNIAASFYNYLISAYPLFILFCYVLVYILLFFYIFQLGRLVTNGQETDSSSTDRSDTNALRRRVNTQTKKSTPHRYQKGKYKNLKQGIRRGRHTPFRGKKHLIKEKLNTKGKET